MRVLIGLLASLSLLSMICAQDKPVALATADEELLAYLARIDAAEAHLRLNETGAARRWLDAVPQSRRTSFEWRYLAALTDQSSTRITGCESSIFGLAASNGTLAASGGDKQLRLFDMDGRQTRVIDHTSETYGVSMTRNGVFVATTNREGLLRVFSVADGKEVATLKGHKNTSPACAFSPDGKLLASVSYTATREEGVKGEVILWDCTAWKELARFSQGVKPLVGVAFSHDGLRLAVASWDDTAAVYDVAERKLLFLCKGHENRVNGVDFSAQGLIATASDDRNARIFDTQGKCLHVLKGHTDLVIATRFSPDGSQLLTASIDNSLRLWDVTSGAELALMRGHTRGVRALCWNADGVFSGGADKLIRVWDPATIQRAAVTPHSDPTVYALAFDAHGRMAMGGGPELRIFDSQCQPITYWNAAPSYVLNLAFSPDGAKVAAAADNGCRVYSSATGRELAVFDGHKGTVSGIVFSNNGARILTCGYDQTARLWDAADGKQLAEFKGHKGRVNAVALSPDGTIVATGGDDSVVRLWDLEGKELAKLTGHRGAVHTLAFSPDGKRLASAGDDAAVRLWDLASRTELALLRGHDTPVYRLAFSPDGTRIASGARELRLWDAASGEAVLTLRPLKDTIWVLAWAHDGNRLGVGSWNGDYAVLETSGISERTQAANAHAKSAAQAKTRVDDVAAENPDWDALDWDAFAVKVEADRRLSDEQKVAVLDEILRRARQK